MSNRLVVVVDDPPTDGQVPAWNASTTKFISTTPSSGGWQTALDLDFTAETTQSLTADGTYTIGGIAGWKKENSNFEATGMVLTNGVGLRIRPGYGPGFASALYDASNRTAPLLWLPLSALSINKLAWQTKFRFWLQISAETLGAGPGLTNNDYTFIGVDDDGTTNDGGTFYTPGYGIFGSTPAQARTFRAGTRRQNETTSNLAGATWAGNPVTTFMTVINSLAAYPLQTMVFYNGTGTAWPAEAAIHPLTGNFNTSVTDFRTFTPSNASTGLGVVLGCAATASSDAYDVTITNLRIDYEL